MPLTDLIAELEYEKNATRKMLERLPDDKMDWKPHDKSMTLWQLSHHVAEIPGYITSVLTSAGVDLAVGQPAGVPTDKASDLVALFDHKVAEALAHMQQADPVTLQQDWSLRAGDHVLFTMPRMQTLRQFALNHFIHHRGQLSVYLRLLEIPVPSIYGPTADEPPKAI